MLWLEPWYLLVAVPGLLLGVFAHWHVRRTLRRYSGVCTRRGLTGAEVAAEILRLENIHDVSVVPSEDWLGDHYSPEDRTLRLSLTVFYGASVAATGVAAHEVGHAVQHARRSPYLRMRSALVPIVQLATPAAIPSLVGAGLVVATQDGGELGLLVAALGLALFTTVILIQLATLPVEIDASRRALDAIQRGEILAPQEQRGARQVLYAAAWTYVASAVSAVFALLYFLMRSGMVWRHE